MKNKFLTLMVMMCLVVITLGTVQAQEEACSDTNNIDISDIPCLGLTNVVNCIGNTNVSVINLNTTVQTNLTTFPVGDGRLNFTFDFNESSYSLVDCQNNSATIIVGQFDQGFGISIFFFIIPLLTLSFATLLVSSKMGKRMLEDEAEMKLTGNVVHQSKWIPTILLLFSFLPFLLLIRIVRGYMEQFIPSTNLISFFGSFYIFFLYLFSFVSLMLIVTLVSDWITLRDIRMGVMDKEW